MEQFIEYFPDHPLAIKQLAKEIPEEIVPLSFKDVALEALHIHARKVEPESLKEYRAALNNWWMPYLAEILITDIDEDTLETLDAELEWPSIKTRNNCLIPLRFVFNKAMKKRIMVKGIKTPLITFDPTGVLENGEPKKTKPDPFSIEERDIILGHFYRLNDTDEMWYHYFVIAFYTGMRTGELLALTWGQIDFRTDYITVDRAYSSGRLKQTKTDEIREFPALPIVMKSLAQLKRFTFLADDNVFFVPPNIDASLKYTKPPARVFQNALKKLGIRKRPTYNTRHTFATAMLMDGVKPGCASKVLGHSLAVFFTKYATWIEGKATVEEMAKIQVNDVSDSIKKSITKRADGRI